MFITMEGVFLLPCVLSPRQLWTSTALNVCNSFLFQLAAWVAMQWATLSTGSWSGWKILSPFVFYRVTLQPSMWFTTLPDEQMWGRTYLNQLRLYYQLFNHSLKCFEHPPQHPHSGQKSIFSPSWWDERKNQAQQQRSIHPRALSWVQQQWESSQKVWIFQVNVLTSSWTDVVKQVCSARSLVLCMNCWRMTGAPWHMCSILTVQIKHGSLLLLLIRISFLDLRKLEILISWIIYYFLSQKGICE